MIIDALPAIATLFPIYYLSQLKHLGSVHTSCFYRAEPNYIARIQIRRRARVELNLVFAQSLGQR